MNRLLLSILLLLCISSAWTYETKIEKDGMLQSNGQRQFILGLYEEAKDDAFAAEAAQAGFNLIRVTPSKESLDRAQKYGMQAWIPLGGLSVSGVTDETNLKNIIESWKSHPAFAVWEAPDEALWNEWWLRSNKADERNKLVEDSIKAFKGDTEKTKVLQAEREKWHSYRSTGRYALADEAEENICKITGLSLAADQLSNWRKGIETTFEKLKDGCQVVRKNDPNPCSVV